MESQNFFVPVKSESLSHYFAKAIILPSSFYTNRPSDIQDQFKNSILLSKNKWVEGMDCSIEICLTDDELTNIIGSSQNTDFRLCTGAIPISRVAAVYFKDRAQSEVTQWNINNGTAFLPSRLLIIEESKIAGSLVADIADAGIIKEDLHEKIRRFDILLGSVAFLNVAKSRTKKFAKDYFAVVGYFNSFIKAQFTARVNSGVATYDDRLTGLYKRDNGWRDIMPVITEDVDYEIVEAAAKRANIKLERKFGLIDIEKLPKKSQVYILALLATYGLNKPKGIPELVASVIATEPDEGIAEEIAAIFGLHLRYSRLRNTYQGKSLVQTKFSLESRLDYYIIESIFQFAFNGRVSANFEYIDKIIPEKYKTNDTALNSYRILDVAVPIESPEHQENPIKEPIKSKLPESEDDKLIYEALKGASLKIQDNTMRIMEDAMRNLAKSLKDRYQSEIVEYNMKISQLNERLTQNEIELLKTGTDKISSEFISGDSDNKLQELDRLEFKDLKKMATNLKISKKILDAIKPTKEGINNLIELINSKHLF